MSANTLVTLSSSVGALLVLCPYWLVSSGRLAAASRRAAALNLISSFVFLLAHIPARVWGSVALDVVWGAIAVAAWRRANHGVTT